VANGLVGEEQRLRDLRVARARERRVALPCDAQPVHDECSQGEDERGDVRSLRAAWPPVRHGGKVTPLMVPEGACKAVCVAVTVAFAGGDWPQWRGPSFNGSAEAVGLPTEWSTTENVAWKTELPGQSAATPVVWGERVFLSSIDDYEGKLLALCLERGSGELLWDRMIGQGRVPSERSRGRENSFAACSPVTDGERVCFLYGTGELVAFDFEGEQLWKRTLLGAGQRFRIQWGYASSPLLWDGLLYVQVLQRDAESYLLAIDPATGKDVWKHLRPDEARAESQEAYTTPIPFDNAGRTEILVLGGDCVSGHDPKSGEELWRWCGMNPAGRPNFRQVSTTVAGENGLLFVTSPQHNPMHGLRVKGDSVEEVWTFAKPSPDSTTPLYYRGLLYAVDGRRQAIVCLRPESGELVWQGELETPSFIRASPTGADGKVYVMDAEGNVVVLKAGEKFEVLARIAMDSYPSRSTIVVDDGQLLIRTADTLYCIGAESEK
jgi:outer membrane protein assembly factor BamB